MRITAIVRILFITVNFNAKISFYSVSPTVRLSVTVTLFVSVKARCIVKLFRFVKDCYFSKFLI